MLSIIDCWTGRMRAAGVLNLPRLVTSPGRATPRLSNGYMVLFQSISMRDREGFVSESCKRETVFLLQGQSKTLRWIAETGSFESDSGS